MIAGSNRFTKTWRGLALSFGLFGLALLQACSVEGDSEIHAGPKEQVLHYSDNSQGKVSDLSARWLLMNYWASWCSPCLKEIPELTKLNDNAQFKVVLYNFDRLQGQALKDEAKKLNIRLPMMLNEPAPMFNIESPSALPATLVLDRTTGEHRWMMGEQTEAGILDKLQASG